MADLRIGQGFDMHPLIAGEGVVLGGVLIPCDLAVEADSDGDVLAHALADAMLGAAGLGDMGILYPPGSEQGRNLSGAQLMARVRSQIERAGWRLVQGDTTLICEQPRLSPWRDRIRESLSQMLHLSVDCINVKATTTDRLGALGRGEGIAALAVVLLADTEADEKL